MDKIYILTKDCVLLVANLFRVIRKWDSTIVQISGTYHDFSIFDYWNLGWRGNEKYCKTRRERCGSNYEILVLAIKAWLLLLLGFINYNQNVKDCIVAYRGDLWMVRTPIQLLYSAKYFYWINLLKLKFHNDINMENFWTVILVSIPIFFNLEIHDSTCLLFRSILWFCNKFGK